MLDYIRFERLALHWQTTPDIARKQDYLAQEIALILAGIDADMQKDQSVKTDTPSLAEQQSRDAHRMTHDLKEMGYDLDTFTNNNNNTTDGNIFRTTADA